MSKKNQELQSLRAENKRLKSSLEERSKELALKEKSEDKSGIENLKQELNDANNENKSLIQQNDKAKKIVKAQQLKTKKIQEEMESFKKLNSEWEGLTDKLRGQLDELNESKEELLKNAEEMENRLKENDPGEIQEKFERYETDQALSTELLNARETQLASLQTRLSELEHENEMMSDRDDQIITLRDELQAREHQLSSLQMALNEKRDANAQLESELIFLRPKFTELEGLNDSMVEELEELRNRTHVLQENLREQSAIAHNVTKMTEQLAAREQTIENLQKLAEEHTIMSAKIEAFEVTEAELYKSLSARESQLQNLQEQLAAGAEAEEQLQHFEVENLALKEKVADVEEQLVETIQAKDQQLSAMKESLAHFDRMKLQTAEIEKKYLTAQSEANSNREKALEFENLVDELRNNLSSTGDTNEIIQNLEKQLSIRTAETEETQNAFENYKTKVETEKNALESGTTHKVTELNELLEGEIEKGKKYKMLAEKFKKAANTLKKKNAELMESCEYNESECTQLSSRIGELSNIIRATEDTIAEVNTENEKLRTSIEYEEETKKELRVELNSMTKTCTTRLDENERLKTEIESLNNDITFLQNENDILKTKHEGKIQDCIDNYEHNIAELDKNVGCLENEKLELIRSEKKLREHLDGFENAARDHREKAEQVLQEKTSALKTQVQESESQMLEFTLRTESLENSISTLTKELQVASDERDLLANKLKSVESDASLDQIRDENNKLCLELERLAALEIEFNRQAEISRRLQETIDEKQMLVKGLQNNNAVQRNTIDELLNEVGVVKEALQIQKNDSDRSSQRIAMLQTQIAEMTNSSGEHQIMESKNETVESLKGQLAVANQGDSIKETSEKERASSPSNSVPELDYNSLLKKYEKLKAESDLRAKKLKAALISRKELISGEKILKKQNEEMKKDLEEKRQLIHSKDETERHLNDKLDVLNETINKMDDRSITSHNDRKESTEDFINQISSLKKLLSESQIDAQTIQRQLDQAEADRLALEGEMANITGENYVLDNSQRNLTNMVKKLEAENMSMKRELTVLTESTRTYTNQIETLELENESFREELYRGTQKCERMDELERDNYNGKNKMDILQSELVILHEENTKLTETKLGLIREKDERARKLKMFEEMVQNLTAELSDQKLHLFELNKSLIQAGKALDDSVSEKDSLDIILNKKIAESEEQLERERLKWENEKNEVIQQKEILLQSSEAAMSKLQGERENISSIRDHLLEQKSLTDKFKYECESWKTKFQDQFGDKSTLEKQVISLKQHSTKLRDDLDQIETEKDMWKTKYDELVSVQTDKIALQKEMNGMLDRLRVATTLAEDKECEVERLKLKYAEIKKSLEYAEKEREIDLKEREAIVYRAESLQREFEHINKLLQNEKRKADLQEKDAGALRLSHQHALHSLRTKHGDEKAKLECTILEFQRFNPVDLQKQIQERNDQFETYQKEATEKITILEKELSSRDQSITRLDQSITDLEQARAALTDEKTQLENENTTLKEDLETTKNEVDASIDELNGQITKLKQELEYLQVEHAKQTCELDGINQANVNLKQQKDALESSIHNLRESFLKKEQESDSEYSVMQAAIMAENKNFREQINLLEVEVDQARKSAKVETDKCVALETQLQRLKIDLAASKESTELLKSEIKSLEFKFKNQKEELVASSRTQILGERTEAQHLASNLREQMSKMQERLNVTELETSSSSNQLNQIQIEINNLRKQNEELIATGKVSNAENERLKAELEQNELEKSRIREDLETKETDLEKKRSEIGEIGPPIDYNVVCSLEQELNVVREKCNLLETQYKVCRRISPRKQLKVGQTIELPPMAPPETYVSSNNQSDISDGQLKVLRTELRQREDLVSRLITDCEHQKRQLIFERKRNTMLKADFDSMSLDMSTKEVLLSDYETKDEGMKTLIRKYESQLDGTYDGDEELLQLIKEKVQEIENVRQSNVDLDIKIKRLKRRLRRQREESLFTLEDVVMVNDNENTEKGNTVLRNEVAKNVTAGPDTLALKNAEEYVSCKLQ